ncbi:MAG: HAD family hydrolase [Syntrophales bacterium]
MVSVELMVFDFDGTLVNSGEDIARSVNFVLRHFQLPAKDHREIMGFIGDGVVSLIERSLGTAHIDKLDEALELFSRYYPEHMLDTSGLYPGVVEILEHFRNKKKIIVTNKRHYFASRMADALKISSYFEEIIGRDNAGYVKPDHRLLRSILDKYAANSRRTVVIGDGCNDIILAKDAGVWSCAFLNGLSLKEDLVRLEPDFTYNDILELKYLFH